MFKSTRHKRKPDLLMLLTIFVCLGVVLTSTVNAAEPANPANSKGWGVELNAESGCTEAAGEWQTCSNWQQQGARDDAGDEALAPQRAALRLSSERLPDTGLVWYYTLSDSRQLEGADAELRFNSDDDFVSGYDSRQFGMALKQRYGSFGLSVGFEADQVNNLTDDPLFYLGVSNRW